MKVYHYASINDWMDIKEGSHDSDFTPGLAAKSRIGRHDREAWNTSAVFALLDPLPEQWTKNKEFPNIWSNLKGNIGRVLLSIDVSDEDKDVFVIDRAEIQRFLGQDNSELDEDENRLARETAEGKYISSKIPLGDYLKKEQSFNFVLPEVIFTKNIPIDKISINEEQPLLQELLDEIKESDYGIKYIKKIQEIPELKNWYENQYLKQEINNEIRFSLR